MPNTGKLFANTLSALIPISVVGKPRTTDGACFFVVDRDVTAAELIAGDVTLIPDSMVPYGMKCYITDYAIRWGATPFATATDVRISDNAGSVDFVTVAIANTNTLHLYAPPAVAQTGVTQGAALTARTGGTVNKGIKLRRTGATPTAGSNFSVRIEGFFAP